MMEFGGDDGAGAAQVCLRTRNCGIDCKVTGQVLTFPKRGL